MARVSIIIPSYNRKDLLPLTLDSVFAQTFRDIEVIVVDDCSTDGTSELLQRDYGERVFCIRNARNIGLVPSCNVGLRAATGEFINFLDSDDIFEPTKLEKQIRLMDARPEISVVNCRHWHINQHGVKIGKSGLMPEGDSVLREIVLMNFWWIGGTLVRRRCFDIIGMLDERFTSQDWDLWLQLALAGYKFACVQEPLGSYRIHQGAMTNSANAELFVMILDKLFNMPNLPARIANLKNQAYATLHCYISSAHYYAGRWDDAKRNLSQALAYCPLWINDAARLTRMIRQQAMSPRIQDPAAYVSGVFNHLPSEIRHITRYRDRILSQAYMIQSLRCYWLGGVKEAKSHLHQALQLNCDLATLADDFTELVAIYAMTLPVESASDYVKLVFRNLPTGASRLGALRGRVIGKVSIATAFECFALRRYSQVPGQVLSAIRYSPSLLANRGVLSIFCKSITRGLMNSYGV